MIRARREYKYIIGGSQEQWVRDWVASRMRLDPFGTDAPDNQYGVYSLYLDSEDLLTYRATTHGHRDRFKLRIRWYTPECTGPGFCEIKARCNEVLWKHRARLHPEYLRDILEGAFPDLSWLTKPSESSLQQAVAFSNKCGDLKAIPAVGVGYTREAYVSDEDEHLRVTFDRKLVIHSPWHIGDQPDVEGWIPLGNRGTILEVKFKQTVARWVHEMVRKLNLDRSAFSKYANGIEFLSLQRLVPNERFRRNGIYDGIRIA